MEASNNPGKSALPSANPASGVCGEPAVPLKLQFEVTLPQELDRELKAWRKSFERFTDIMERWLENSLAHPGIAPPPGMTWTVAPTPPAEPLPPPINPQPILPNDIGPILVEETRSIPDAATRQDARLEKPVDPQPTEVRATPPLQESIAAPAADSDFAEQAALHAQRGERHRATGDKGKALACYRQALDLDPNCTQAYLGRASVYIEQGRYNEALLACDAALEREPERAVLYVLRGLAHSRQGDLKRAVDEAEFALRFDPHLPSAYVLRGTARFKKGMMSQALEDVKTAIRLRPTDAKFHAELARMLARTGQHDQAARSYAKVLELAPNLHEAHLQRGVAMRQCGNTVAAESELTQYLRHCPGNAVAHYQRGLCRVSQRNYSQAISDFDKALALKPDDWAAKEAKEKALQQWEGTARPTRAGSLMGTAATLTRTETQRNTPATVPTKPMPMPPKPAPAKSTPAKTKPAPSQPSYRAHSWQDDDEPSRWAQPAKWSCIVALVCLLGFGSFRLLANVINNPYKPDSIPATSATLSAEDLWKRFQSNPATAKAELSEHFIEVTGMIERHFDGKTPPVVILSVAGSNATVTCTLKANMTLHQQMLLSRIQGDSKATLVGMCAGTQNNTIALSECLLVKVIRGNGKTRR